jgi:peroxiredoxin
MTDQMIGKSIPDLLPGADCSRFSSLHAAMEDRRAAVVVFWSGVCSHCARYDAYLNSFPARHPNIALVVVASRQEESRHEVQTTAARRGLQFPILYDHDRKVAHAWLVHQTPRAFLVDAGLQLIYRGAIDNFKYAGDPEYQPYLENAMDDLLAARRIARAETPSFGCPIESVYYSLPQPVAAC